MFWLDWKLFGNGHGMAQPYFDGAFYWLTDMNLGRSRNGRNGRFYRFGGGFGAQLFSTEWRTPKPGTRRRLFGRDFVVHSARRKWLRVDVAWTAAPAVRDHSALNDLREQLVRWGHGQ